MKRINMRKKLILALSAMAIFLIGGCANVGEGSLRPSEDTTFKEMKTTDITGNESDSSIFFENKLTLVNVWNTGCTPCIDEIPILDKLNEEYKSNGVAIKGLLLESGEGLTDKEREVAEEILSKSKSSYQQLTMSKEMLEGNIFETLATFPTTFFIDSNGNIVHQIEGSDDYEGWKAKIETVLKGVE